MPPRPMDATRSSQALESSCGWRDIDISGGQRHGGAMSDPDRQILASVLEWSLAMGADAVIADEAIDWLTPGRAAPGADFELSGDPSPEDALASVPAGVAPRAGPAAEAMRAPSTAPPGTARATGSAPPPLAQPPRRPAAVSPDSAVGSARAAARKAQSLDALGAALNAFDGCGLKTTAKSLCFYRGAAAAPLMIIGEAPGRDEDIAGRPFVGRAGQMLDRMLAAIGYGEDNVHITNIVYWRPPGNRTPTPQEAEVCRPFIERQIELVNPRVLLLLGGSAAKHITRSEEGILRLRGKWLETEISGRKYKTIASLHPAFLLRSPAHKRQAWRDFLEVRQAVAAAAG